MYLILLHINGQHIKYGNVRKCKRRKIAYTNNDNYAVVRESEYIIYCVIPIYLIEKNVYLTGGEVSSCLTVNLNWFYIFVTTDVIGNYF